MTEIELFKGGCRCGGIRYQVSGPPVMVEYCHCVSCRKSGGSAVTVFAGFQRTGFEITNGNPTGFNAATAVNRSFCGHCGTPLFYENQNYPEDLYIHLGSFDQQEELPPDRHVWVSERISWYEINDDLPQYDEFSGSGRPEGAPPYKKPVRP